jgi:hypothetical protein
MRDLLLVFVVVVAACGGDSKKKYDTYQACFDDVIKQDKTDVETIVECCLEYEVGGMMGPLCGATDPDCINYLTINLDQTDADIQVKQQACAAYVAEKAMQ